MAERTVILYTFSKRFAMTGWRLGAAIGSRRNYPPDRELNVNDELCPNHFIQYGALEGLTGDQSGPRCILRVLQERRDAALTLLDQTPGSACYSPNTTFYLFPNVTAAMRLKGFTNVEDFLCVYCTTPELHVCEHFGRPRRGEREQFVRLAYSGFYTPQILEGLTCLRTYMGDETNA